MAKPLHGRLTLQDLKDQLMTRLRSDLHLGQLEATPAPLGLVWNPAGKEPRHLGLVFRVAVPRNIADFLDEKQFKTNGRGYPFESSFVRPEALADDTAGPQSYTFEEWSLLLLKEKWLP